MNKKKNVCLGFLVSIDISNYNTVTFHRLSHINSQFISFKYKIFHRILGIKLDSN